MGVQKVILVVRLQVELPSSDLAKKKVCHISQLFSKSSTMCRPKNATSANFFQKAQLCVAPKCHISQLFSKNSTVSPQNATSANFFQKAQLCVTQKCHISQLFSKSSTMCRPKNATSANFFQKTQLCVTVSQKCYQCHMANLFLPFKLGTSVNGTSVCGLCSQPLKCEL